LREIVRDGKCEVNGRHENRGYRVRANDFLELHLDLTRENAMQPEDVPLDIVFEDENLIVVNKAAGMLVHPTHRDKAGTLLNALAHHLNLGKNGSPAIRPGLIHRLDKQTSGLLVVAKSDRVHRIIAKQFQRKSVEKLYLALVQGRLEESEGTIEAPIGRYPELKHWDIKADGKQAVTRYRVRDRNIDTTLLELEPVTGRTNQLRIHCAHIGHPIVGDTKRGGGTAERLYLHAWRLSFRHPATNEPISFTAGPPF
ncbi:MAG TPA: RluA family pseudouridine synthase, partial [Pyrinomonadaceae bacterium]|nr:RluA family pseudouridine synthase [Pyrinomonadaceae bacterium]